MSRCSRWLITLLPVCLVLLLAPGALNFYAAGQGIITGGITGTVVDPTGAVVPDATVTAISESSGTSLQAKTNGEGSFQISDVPLGLYTVTIRATGFGMGQITHVNVVAGNATQLGRQTLKLGSASQTVEVEGGAAQLLNTESSQGEEVIDTVQLQSLPVNGAMDNVTLMVPGVVQTHSDGMSNTNGVNYSVNGQRGRANNSEIDGQSNNDNSIGGPSFFFSNQDAVAEVQVITNDFSAQYGRNMGAVVNYITKSGTNQFHGTAFEEYTGSFLSSLLQFQKDPQFGFCSPGESPSTGCSPVSIPRFVQNNWGGTLGGPILKDKLFFFGGTYWTHQYESGSVATSDGAVFPDATGLSTLQASFPNNPGVTALVNQGPYAVKAGNPTAFGPTSTLQVTDGTTVANVEVSQFKRTLPQYTLDQEELGRIDYQMTAKDRFFLRYNYQNNPTVPTNNSAAGNFVNVNGITHEVGGDWTHTFTSNFIDQLRYSFQQSTIAFEGGAVPSCTISSFDSCPSSVTLGGNLSGFGLSSNLPQGRVVKVNQVQDNASWTRGRMTILFGGEYDHQNSPNAFLPNASGAFNFTPGTTSVPIALPASANSTADNGISGLLQGISQTDLAAGSPSVPFKEPDFALYAQDNWKVTSNLTLNLGLRYEFFSQAANLLHTESVAQQTGPNPYWNTSLPLSATTAPAINSDLRNIEPRFGLAYVPSFSPKMVIHAGFAINVDPEFYNIFLNLATDAPVINSGSFVCDGMTVKCVPSGGLTYGTVQSSDTQFLPTGGDPRTGLWFGVPKNFRNPMSENYTLGIQYQVMPSAVAEIRYVGNHTFGQFQAVNGNPDVLDVQSAFPNYGSGTPVCTDTSAPGYTRPNCNFFIVENTDNSAFSIYNGLQSSLTLREFHHLTGTASYTYSRTIDNVSEIFSTGSAGTTSAFAQDPLNSDVGERGVSGNSYPNVWGVQLLYNTPWFQGQHGILGRTLGGYFANLFYQYNGGEPFNPIQDSLSVQSPAVLSYIAANPAINATEAENSFCDAIFASVFGNPCRPILSNPRAPLGSIGINTGPGGYIDYVTGNSTLPSAEHWLWNNQYEALAEGKPFPGVGRNILRGHSFNNIDMTVGKNIHLTEHVNTLLQMSVFNVFNRAYYGSPDPNIEDSWATGQYLNDFYGFGTGAESSAAGGAYGQGPGNRNVQLSGKITF